MSALLTHLRLLLRISRPAFWMYLFAPFAVGVLIGAPDNFSQQPALVALVAIFAIYFLFPANLLAYGLNDIFDYESDKKNPKKTDPGALLPPDKHRRVASWITFFNIPFVLASFFLDAWAIGAFLLFLFLTVFYSAEPIRAKTKPVLDSLFNALYIVPGIFGYYLVGGQDLRWPIVAAAILWSMALHAYSAVPDIHADTEAGLRTIATTFGKKITLIICLALYLAASILAAQFLGNLSRTLGIIYAILVVITIQQKTSQDLLTIYSWFPLFNMITGMALFLMVLLNKLRG